jgi:hypothetical protein
MARANSTISHSIAPEGNGLPSVCWRISPLYDVLSDSSSTVCVRMFVKFSELIALLVVNQFGDKDNYFSIASAFL